MANIFINYRRGESLKDARHLAALLEQGPIRRRVFIDIKGLDGSPDWLHQLERQVAASDAMIAIICPGWAEVKDADGKRRLDDDKDFVRLELAEAFRRNIPVVPVLVDQARMPSGRELPDSLLYLTRPQAELLRLESFDTDAAKIARRIDNEVSARRKRGLPVWAATAAAIAALVGGVVAGATAMERFSRHRPSVGFLTCATPLGEWIWFPGSPVNPVMFRDDHTVATANIPKEPPTTWTQDGRNVTVRWPHFNSIDQLVLSPDGKQLVGTYGKSATFQGWQTTSTRITPCEGG